MSTKPYGLLVGGLAADATLADVPAEPMAAAGPRVCIVANGLSSNGATIEVDGRPLSGVIKITAVLAVDEVVRSRVRPTAWRSWALSATTSATARASPSTGG